MTSYETIFGYGSLMDVDSTKMTMPSAINFRPGVLTGYRRIFSLVSISGIRNGSALQDSKEVAALAIYNPSSPSECLLSSPSKDDAERMSIPAVKGVLFEIPSYELDHYFEREHRYKRVKVIVHENAAAVPSGLEQQQPVECWTVVQQTDEEYLASMNNDAVEYRERVGQYYTGQLWGNENILPMPSYLKMVIWAAEKLQGREWVLNILDQAYLADRKTTIRSYILSKPDKYLDVLEVLDDTSAADIIRPACSRL